MCWPIAVDAICIMELQVVVCWPINGTKIRITWIMSMGCRFSILYLLIFILAGCNETSVSYSGKGVVVPEVDGEYESCAEGMLCWKLPSGTAIRLHATPADGYRFSHWEGQCIVSADYCDLKASGHATAVFVADSETPLTVEMRPQSNVYLSTPWPNDTRRSSDGSLDVNGFPFEKDGQFSKQLISLAKTTKGFATNAGVFFKVSHDVRGLHIDDDVVQSSAYLVPVDDLGEARVPVHVQTMDGQLTGRDNILTFLPQETLKPNTRYALFLLGGMGKLFNDQAPELDPLMEALQAQSSGVTGISDRDYREFKAQFESIKNWILHSDALEIDATGIIAFTVFTTQDTERLHQYMKNTVAGWTDEMIIDRLINFENVRMCGESDPLNETSEVYSLTFNMPHFLSGSPPYLLSGGGFEIEDNRFIAQGEMPLTLHVVLPCAPRSPYQNDYGIDVIGSETASSANPNSVYYNTGFVRVFLDAPFSRPNRNPPISSFLSWLLELAGIDDEDIFLVLSHFNPFNLEANIGLHYHYALEMQFAKRVGDNIDNLINRFDKTPINSDKVGYAGWSFGGIAAFHNAAIDLETDVIRVYKLTRPNYQSLNHLLKNNYYVPQALLDAISDYVGVSFPLEDVDPTLHLLQTILEPTDLGNFVEAANGKNMWIEMDFFNSEFHGGDATFRMLSKLDKSEPFGMNYWLRYSDTDQLSIIENYIGRDYIFGDFYSPMNSPLRIVLDHVQFGDCFPYNVFELADFHSRYYWPTSCVDRR